MRKFILIVLGIIAILVVISKFRDPIQITDEDRARSMAKDFVEKKLISPTTAEFCSIDETSITPAFTGFLVKGWVDSQNAYGAVVRNNYEVTLHKEGEYWICDLMLLNGLKVN